MYRRHSDHTRQTFSQATVVTAKAALTHGGGRVPLANRPQQCPDSIGATSITHKAATIYTSTSDVAPHYSPSGVSTTVKEKMREIARCCRITGA